MITVAGRRMAPHFCRCTGAPPEVAAAAMEEEFVFSASPAFSNSTAPLPPMGRTLQEALPTAAAPEAVFSSWPRRSRAMGSSRRMVVMVMSRRAAVPAGESPSTRAIERRLPPRGSASAGGLAFKSATQELCTSIPSPLSSNIKTQPEPLLWGLGETARFTAEAFGLGPFGYQWRKDGAPLVEGGRFSGTTGPTLSIAAVENGDAGMYDCVVSSATCGSVTTEAAAMSVRAAECIGMWTLASTTGPGARYGHGMTFDSVRGNTVLFGGTTANSESGRRSDTWTWDGSTWTVRSVSGPSPRLESPMVFDEARGVAILTGGYLGGNQRSRETWDWNGSAWTLRSSTAPRRSNHLLLYRPAENLTYMLTGYDESWGRGAVDDPWVWNGSMWTQRPLIPCQPRLDAVGWVRADDTITIFGGFYNVVRVPLHDQWDVDASGTWVQRQFRTPSPRWDPIGAIDRLSDTPLMFGGGTQFDGTTWVPDDALWTLTPDGWRKTSARGPLARAAGVMVHDRARDRFVLFGGVRPDALLGDTWELAIKRPPVISSGVQDIACCAGETAQFEVSGTGGAPISYQWRRNGITLQEGATPNGSYVSGVGTSNLEITFAAKADEGNYDLIVSNSCGSVVTQSAMLTVCACLSCPADFNLDGGIDGGDIDSFFAAWEAGDCDADVNSDGGVDGEDVSAFYAAWEAGGC